jgi:hypothetical protein
MNEAGQTEGERDNANDAKNPKSLVMKHADNCDRRIEGERSDKSTFNEPPWRYEIRMSGERAEPEITNRPCLDTQHNRTKKENYSTHSVFSYWFHFCELEATPNVVYFGTAAMRWTNGAEFTSKTSWERFLPPPVQDHLIQFLAHRFHVGIAEGAVQRADVVRVRAGAADGVVELRRGHFTG